MNFGIFEPNMAWSLLALIIPVVIHLLSRSKGKIVKVAYTHLIASPKQKTVADIRLEQPWLLLLRLLVLILLSLLLVQLWFNDSPTRVADQSIIAVSPNWLDKAESEQRETLAQTIQASPNLSYLLSAPISKLTAQQIRQWQPRMAPLAVNNVWTQAASVSNKLPNASSLYIYALGSAADFWGSKVSLVQKIDWHLLEAPTDFNTQEPINVVLLANQNTPYLAHWQQALLALKQGPLPGLEIDTLADNAVIDNPQEIDWLIPLSASSANEKPDIEQISTLNRAVEQINFPLLLGEAIVKKRQPVLSHFAALTAEQVSYNGDMTQTHNNAASLATPDPTDPNNMMLVLGILLILTFCTERLISERKRPPPVSDKETL